MSLFDYIKIEIPCANCETILNDWQSKSGPCHMLELPYWEVDQFYTICENCSYWNEYHLKKDKKYRPLSDYEFNNRDEWFKYTEEWEDK